MKIRLSHKFEDIVGVDNLLLAWKEFLKGKKNKSDVQAFQFNLMDNILSLHDDLVNYTYHHGGYQCFKINDPKPRIIHKAGVRDRLLHHAVYRILYPFFDRTFISDSFSCRINKGTYKALSRFKRFSHIASKNGTKICWVLKCDIRKFFASIDQDILLNILKEYISDEDIINILSGIIFSFHSTELGKGLPLGNLTSQLFANVYMNEFDQFAKHKLKSKYYIRYADDFVILSEDKNRLKEDIPAIGSYLKNKLILTLHPNKVFIKTIYSGVDFLGWTNFLNYKTLRRVTKNRIFRNMEKDFKIETLSSYLGLLKHGNSNKVLNKVISLNNC